MRFLVTAGNTREMIDRVRDWGNIFTGNTGLAIARALAERGEVDLLTSNRIHIEQIQSGDKSGISSEIFNTHAQLKERLSRLISANSYDAIFMTAAVSDYRPSGVFAVSERRENGDGTETWTVRADASGKVKSTYARIAVLGEPTEKLVDLFRSKWCYGGMLVKFKLEVGLDEQQLKVVAEQSRLTSGADYIVANTLDMVSGPKAGAWLLSDGQGEWVAREDLANRMARLVGP